MDALSIELARARARAALIVDDREAAREILLGLTPKDAPWAAELLLRLALREGSQALQDTLDRVGDLLPADSRVLYGSLASGDVTESTLDTAAEMASTDPYGFFLEGVLLATQGREEESRNFLGAFLEDPADPWVGPALPPAGDCNLARTLVGAKPSACLLCGQPADGPVCPYCTSLLLDPAAMSELTTRAVEDPRAAAWLDRLEDLSAGLGVRPGEVEKEVGWADPNDYRILESDDLLPRLGEDGCAVVAAAGDPLTLGTLVGALRRQPKSMGAVDNRLLDALSEEAAYDQAPEGSSTSAAAYWALHLSVWLAALDRRAQGKVRLSHLAAGIAWAAIADRPEARALWPWIAADAHGMVVYFASDAQKAQLAELLEGNPVEPFLRVLQLCWSRRDVEAGGAREPYERAVLWLLAHHPWLMLPVLTLLRPEDSPEAYRRAVDAWAEIAEKEEDPVVLDRLASFFHLAEPRVSEAAYRRLRKLQPREAEWGRWLSHLYALHRQGASKARKSRVELALVEAEQAARLAPDSDLRYYLGHAVELALEADDLERAERWGAALLESVAGIPEEVRSDWNYGNVLHKANMVLGRVALRRGDQEEACRRLLEAGRTPGSPQLDSFGPNVRLAAELLEAGEQDTVLEFLELCRSFWGMGKERLDAWTMAIQKGRPVRFGANLNY